MSGESKERSHCGGVDHAGLVNHCEVRLLLQGWGVRAEV